MATETHKDRAQQLKLLDALDAARSQLRRDDARWWVISSRDGLIDCWGDDASWGVYVRCRSARHWTATKRRLAFLTVTQDGDDEGCFRLFDLPTPERAEVVRDVLGLRRKRRYDPTTLEKLRATAGGLSRARTGPEAPSATLLMPDDGDGAPRSQNPLPAGIAG